MVTKSSETESAAQQVMRQCGDNFWGQCKQYPKSDWKYSVVNNDTVLGYWEWVVNQAESDEVRLKSLKGSK